MRGIGVVGGTYLCLLLFSIGKRFQWELGEFNICPWSVSDSCLRSVKREKLRSVAGISRLGDAVWEVTSILPWVTCLVVLFCNI